MLSFDSLRQAPEDPAIAALTRLVSRGGRIMWGMVDPVDPSDARSVGLLAGVISMFGNALSPVEVLAASLLSPSCGPDAYQSNPSGASPRPFRVSQTR